MVYLICSQEYYNSPRTDKKGKLIMENTKKETTFNINGITVKAKENAVYNILKDSDKALSGKEVFNILQEKGNDVKLTEKGCVSTLARLNTTHGLLKKNEPVKVTTYEVA